MLKTIQWRYAKAIQMVRKMFPLNTQKIGIRRGSLSFSVHPLKVFFQTGNKSNSEMSSEMDPGLLNKEMSTAERKQSDCRALPP